MIPEIIFPGNGVDCAASTSTQVLIGGDWSPPISQNTELVLQEGRAYYGGLSELATKADLAVINVETVLADSSILTTKSGPSAIAEPHLAEHLKQCGFDVACLANNHICDAGKQGLSQTIRSLMDAGLKTLGAGCTIADIYTSLQYRGEKDQITLINASDGIESNEKFNLEYGAADIESWRIAKQITKAKEGGALVIIIGHAGAEFLPIPTPRIRRLYREFIELGADLVVGHHPHVIQGYETYKSRPIFYSLGNFGICRGYRRRSETIGIVLSVAVVDQQIDSLGVIPLENTPVGIRRIEQSSCDQFFDFWRPAMDLLGDEEKYAAVWNRYVQRYDLFAKSTDIFWESVVNPVRARNLFRNLLTDNCFREHQQHDNNTFGENEMQDAERILDQWGAFRSRKAGAKTLSALLSRLGPSQKP